jgi:hypothetical protein
LILSATPLLRAYTFKTSRCCFALKPDPGFALKTDPP